MLLITLIVVCLITDLKDRKIYNKVLLPALIIALILSFISEGFMGVGYSILGLFLGMAFLIIPYAISGGKGMGAGDVKLMGVIGAIGGSIFVLKAFFFTAIAGGVIALIVLFNHKQLKNTLEKMAAGLFAPVEAQLSFPYGVAIFIGTLVALITERMMIWQIW